MYGKKILTILFGPYLQDLVKHTLLPQQDASFLNDFCCPQVEKPRRNHLSGKDKSSFFSSLKLGSDGFFDRYPRLLELSAPRYFDVSFRT